MKQPLAIYLDAGHGESVTGAYDPGAVGPTGLRENTVTIDLVQRLGHLLRARGVTVHDGLTGDTDHESLTEATKAANALGVNLFVSLHCNAAADRTAHGFEVLCRDAGTEGYRVAYRILRTVKAQLVDGESKWLTKPLPVTMRGVKIRHNLHVLNATNMPAVLAECLFVSNQAEEKQLRDPHILQALAQALADGIVGEG